MARYYGLIGYAETVEIEPGLWVENITERPYYGEIVRNIRKLQTSDSVNDDVTISNEISIVADPYAIQNFHAMRYAKYMGARWKIVNVEVKYPRLTISLGGVYNGESPGTSSET